MDSRFQILKIKDIPHTTNIYHTIIYSKVKPKTIVTIMQHRLKFNLKKHRYKIKNTMHHLKLATMTRLTRNLQ